MTTTRNSQRHPLPEAPESEADLLSPLISWLHDLRWVRGDTLIAGQIPWYGRRIDLAILTSSGGLTSFELKIRNTRRAIEQASYNALAFDRSYVVTTVKPGLQNLSLASAEGVGLLLFAPTGPRIIQRPVPRSVPLLRQRLLTNLPRLAENRRV